MADEVKMSDLKAKAEAFLTAGYEYWKCARASGIGGAVIWLESGDGHTIIFTRGEYRDSLMKEVHKLGLPVFKFSAPEPSEDDLELGP